jgi:hypothetical protein
MKEYAGKTQRENRSKNENKVERTKEIHNRENEERTVTILLH